MSSNGKSRIPELVKKYEADLLTEWTREQVNAPGLAGRIKEGELREQCGNFLRQFQEAAQSDNLNVTAGEWNGVRELLTDVSRTRSLQGFSPSETATFVFSLKQPLFERLRREVGKDPEVLATVTSKGEPMRSRARS
jgi:rsbT co-antagonist protein RsbR